MEARSPKMSMQAVMLTLVLVSEASSLATIVQTLSSRYSVSQKYMPRLTQAYRRV